MDKRLVALSTLLIILALGGGSLHAQTFFDGKTIRFVVGFAPGGGFDTYARVISRHMGRHIPGNPTIVVENMTGAGSLIAANHLYRVAKPDGLTIGHFNGALFLGQAQRLLHYLSGSFGHGLSIPRLPASSIALSFEGSGAVWDGSPLRAGGRPSIR